MRKSKAAALAHRAANSESAFFSKFPAEIRNKIYHFAAINTQTFSIAYDRPLYSSALGVVCHQMRDEYEQIYLEEAPKHAGTIKVNLLNFRHFSAHANLGATVTALASRGPGQSRRYLTRVFVNNQLGSLSSKIAEVTVRGIHNYGRVYLWKGDLEIWYEPKTFDVDACKESLRKAYGQKQDDTDGVTRAFAEAFKRYEVVGARQGRKRKRQ